MNVVFNAVAYCLETLGIAAQDFRISRTKLSLFGEKDENETREIHSMIRMTFRKVNAGIGKKYLDFHSVSSRKVR